MSGDAVLVARKLRHWQIFGEALAIARRHRTLGVLVEPLRQMLGVTTVAAGLAPAEPLRERLRLPPDLAVDGLALRYRPHRRAHVQQAECATGQRFPAVWRCGDLFFSAFRRFFR